MLLVAVNIRFCQIKAYTCDGAAESSDVKVLSGAERRKEGEQQPQQLQQPQQQR